MARLPGDTLRSSVSCGSGTPMRSAAVVRSSPIRAFDFGTDVTHLMRHRAGLQQGQDGLDLVVVERPCHRVDRAVDADHGSSWTRRLRGVERTPFGRGRRLGA